MRKFGAFLTAGIVLTGGLLSGCQTATPPPPIRKLQLSPEQQQCLKRCAYKNKHCDKKYKKIYQQCVEQARQQAKLNYSAYLNNQKDNHAKSKDIKKKYYDFYDTSHCKQQLMCKADYTLCYKNCGL